MKQSEFAELFGVTQVAISNWEKGENPPSTAALARLATLTSDEDLRQMLLAETGIESLAGTPSGRPKVPDMVRAIPMLRDPVAAGTPRATDEREVEQTLVLPKMWFPPGGELYAVKVAGESMAPIINDGYIVIINTSQRDPKRLIERMVAAREGDGVTIKWLRKDGDIYMLVPQHVSPRYQVRVMRPEGDFSIVGAVVRWIGEPPPVRK